MTDPDYLALANRPDIYAILRTELGKGQAHMLAQRIEAALGWERHTAEHVARYTVRYLSKLNLTVQIGDIIGWTPDIDDPLRWVEFTQEQHDALLAAVSPPTCPTCPTCRSRERALVWHFKEHDGPCPDPWHQAAT